MSTGRIDVRQNFTIAFDVNLGASDGGADGAAFVLHNDPRGVNAIGAAGSGLAIGGIQNGLAIEFDTYDSTAANLSGAGMPGSDIAATTPISSTPTAPSPPRAVALPNIENGGVASRRCHLECDDANSELHLRQQPAAGAARSPSSAAPATSLRNSSAAPTSPISASALAQAD